MADVSSTPMRQPRYESVTDGLPKNGSTPGGIFSDATPETFFFETYRKTAKLAAKAISEEPEYQPDSRKRDTWLWNVWRSDSLTTGLISSLVQRDVHRGWSLVGPYSTVRRTKDIFHSADAGDGWRAHVEFLAEAFYCTDIGAIIHTMREGKVTIGEKNIVIPPLDALYAFDPTRCRLTGEWQQPVEYEPYVKPRTRRTEAQKKAQKKRKLIHGEAYRFTSLRDVREEYRGLGYCFLSRSLQLIKMLIMAFGHYDEMLGSRAPSGFLLLNGISEDQFRRAMGGHQAMLDKLGREYFGDLAVLASEYGRSLDGKFLSFSQLPEGFDLKEFVEMTMMGLSLNAGYPADEFWQVSTGRGFGREGESREAFNRAGGKGRNAFLLAHQEQLQMPGFLSNRIWFEYERHDLSERLAYAQLMNAWVTALNALVPLIGLEETKRIGVEEGILPTRITTTVEDSIATDEARLKNPADEPEAPPATDEPALDTVSTEETVEPVEERKQRLLDNAGFRDRLYDIVHAARSEKLKVPDNEPIIEYRWRLAADGFPVATYDTLWDSAADALRVKSHPAAAV